MILDLKNRAAVVFGAALLAIIGRDAFYERAQSRRGISGRIASAFCKGHAGRVSQNFAIWNAEKDKERITDIALSYYSDDSLHGFADEDFAARADGKPLLEQQRGLIIPLVERAIEKDKPTTVVEIGAANGDVLAYLSAKYPKIEFIGIDLSVVVAQKKYGSVNSNMRFMKGYALDLLPGLKPDIVFGTSTFVVFAPKELGHYLDALQACNRIIISDPVTMGNKHTADPEPKSRHMDLYMWWHNYFGWLTSKGWTSVDEFKTVNFAYSHNPNAKIVLMN